MGQERKSSFERKPRGYIVAAIDGRRLVAMRIAQVAPIWGRCPPEKYGGIELIVSLLTEELVRRGHDVTIFATGNSITKANLRSIYDKPPRELVGSPIPGLLHAQYAFQTCKFETPRFNVIHSHIGILGIVLSSFLPTPTLHTLHGIFPESAKKLFLFNKDKFYNSVSDSQRVGCPELNYVCTVYNAIDVEKFEFNPKKEDHFIFISRFSPEKGAHLAIDIAKRAGIKLIISGKVDPCDREYYQTKIKPFVDGEQIIEVPELEFQEKVKLYGEAKAFIFPLQWSEPFGLVMIEAMATGTPVIAFKRGSVPEIVKNEATGWVVDTVDEMISIVKTVDSLSDGRRAAIAMACRKHVESNFSVERMVDDYERAYEVISGQFTPSAPLGT